MGASVQKSLYLSLKVLTGIVMALIVGLSGIIPLALLVWIGFKLYGVLVGSSKHREPTLAAASPGSKLVVAEEKPADGDAPTKG